VAGWAVDPAVGLQYPTRQESAARKMSANFR